MRRASRGLWVYICIIILFMAVFSAMNRNAQSTDTYTYQQFKNDVKNEKIEEVVIAQNEEVPTGILRVTTTDGERKQVYVSDVNDVQEYLDKEGETDLYTLRNVPGESFISAVLPNIIMIIILIVFFVMMTRGAGGGGANGKMMNFGKSGATMTTGENVKERKRKVRRKT